MLQHIKNQFKYCPFCGKENTFIFDGVKVLNCSNCKRTYFVNPAAACGAIIESPLGIIFTERKFEPKKGFIDLPGGFIDLHERVEIAIRRELEEEISFVPEKLDFVYSYPNDYIYDNMLYTTLDLFFYSRISFVPELKAGDDASLVKFIKREDIDLSLLAFPSISKSVEYVLLNIKH